MKILFEFHYIIIAKLLLDTFSIESNLGNEWLLLERKWWLCGNFNGLFLLMIVLQIYAKKLVLKFFNIRWCSPSDFGD